MSESCRCSSSRKSKALLLAGLITNCFGHTDDNLVWTFAGFWHKDGNGAVVRMRAK